jgi:hypothetical protein
MQTTFHTVPWAPGLELRQLTRDVYMLVRLAAVCWQLGIRKGFGREVVKARLRSDPTSSAVTLAIDLGMLEENCSGMADEFAATRGMAAEVSK